MDNLQFVTKAFNLLGEDIKAITVRELIEALSLCDQDVPVSTYYGSAPIAGIAHQDKNGVTLLNPH